MASTNLGADSAPATPHVLIHPRAFPPMPAVARILSQFERPQLASFIEVAISLLDQEDGDPDVELTGAEDDFMEHVPLATAIAAVLKTTRDRS
jgi:hypothetical protein